MSKNLGSTYFQEQSSVVFTSSTYAPFSLPNEALGGLVVKMLACCTGGHRFDLLVENPKYSKDIHKQNPSWMSFG